MQLSEATRGIEQRDATIITLKKNLRAARDRSASPAFGLPIMAGESSLSKKKSLQHENELTVSLLLSRSCCNEPKRSSGNAFHFVIRISLYSVVCRRK